MKYILLLFILCGTCFAVDFNAKLQAVKSGKLKEARAEWWGYNSKDCTDNLQKALNSGVKKLIISKQGSPWIVNKTLHLKSNMEIVFEKDAEILAAKGAFKSNVEQLFKARSVKNIIMRGKGIIKMRHDDYMDRTKYKHGEHRHTLGLYSSADITIKDLTMVGSGGDGIYVNNINNLVVDGVVLDYHVRQGISVISGENILIKNSVIKNTRGAAPQCGIDIEPNWAKEKISNIRIVNCLFENNKHSAVNVSLALKEQYDHPADIIVENCTVNGGNFAFSSMIPGRANEPVGTLRKGRFLIKNCKIKNVRASAFYFQSHRIDGEKVIVENCTVDTKSKAAPILFLIRKPAFGIFGGIEFKNCKINAPNSKALLEYVTFMPQAILSDIKGEIIYNSKKVDLANYIKAANYDKLPLMLTAYIPILGIKAKLENLEALDLRKWKIKTDPENIGEKEHWEKADAGTLSKWANIEGTNYWEKEQRTLKNYDGTAWYAKYFKIPKTWKGRKLYLYFGAIDERAKIFLNGKMIGERLYDEPYNWMIPFGISLDEHIDWSKAEQKLMVMVNDSAGGGGIIGAWVLSIK